MTNYCETGYIYKKDNGEEDILYIPYNIENFLINENDVINLLDKYNVKLDKINHIDYFQKAFTHKSYCKKNYSIPTDILNCAKLEINNEKLLELQDTSYERLEYFGDRVLKLIVSFYLFHRYPKQDEGFMTRLQIKLEDKKNLAIMSKEIGLGKFFIISKQIEMINGRGFDKLHEDIFEAFLGALFLSNGFEPCMYFIVNLLETLIDYSEKLYCDNNYKDILLRVHDVNKWKSPKYGLVHSEGIPPNTIYIMGVEKQNITSDISNEDKYISFGIGTSKKEGEQNAAKMALIILNKLNKDQYIEKDIYYPDWNKIKNYDGINHIILKQKIVKSNIQNDDDNDNDSIYSEKSV